MNGSNAEGARPHFLMGKTFCHRENSGNEVDVRNLFPKTRIRITEAAKLALFTLKNLKFQRTSLSLVFVSNSKIRFLNAKYLNHPWATDVIAFPLVKRNKFQQKLRMLNPRFRGGDRLNGEVIISPEQAEAYSKKNDVPLYQELARYICHGILHLKGYTDASKRARRLMRKKEDALMKAFERRPGAKKVI